MIAVWGYSASKPYCIVIFKSSYQVAWHSTRVIAKVPNTTKTAVQLEYSFSTQILDVVAIRALTVTFRHALNP